MKTCSLLLLSALSLAWLATACDKRIELTVTDRLREKIHILIIVHQLTISAFITNNISIELTAVATGHRELYMR